VREQRHRALDELGSEGTEVVLGRDVANAHGVQPAHLVRDSLHRSEQANAVGEDVVVGVLPGIKTGVDV
jgi:hypothetical protein